MATDNGLNGISGHHDHEVDPASQQVHPCSKCAQLNRQLNEAYDKLDKAEYKYQNEKMVTVRLMAKTQSIEAELFNYKKEIEHFEAEEKKVEKLTAELNQVYKKSTVIGEMFQNLKDKMDGLSGHYLLGSDQLDHLELKCDYLEKELESKIRDLTIKTRDLDYYKAKSAESEAIVSQKDEQITRLNALIVKIRDDNKKKMAIEQARIVALEHSRDAYENRILKMNEERGLPITTNGLTVQGGHGTGHHGSAASSTTLTAPSTSNTDHGHNRDDSSDSYVELSD